MKIICHPHQRVNPLQQLIMLERVIVTVISIVLHIVRATSRD